MSPKIKLCKEKQCSNQQTTAGYCRLHYLKNWRTIREEKRKKVVKDLNRYVDSIVKRNPDRGVQNLKENLRDEIRFGQSMNIFESSDELNGIMEDLGYKSDLDFIFDHIKVDDTF